MGAARTGLLKNVNGTLPLIKPRSLVVVGSDGGPAKKGPNRHPGSSWPRRFVLFHTNPVLLTNALVDILVQGWGSGCVENSVYLINI